MTIGDDVRLHSVHWVNVAFSMIAIATLLLCYIATWQLFAQGKFSIKHDFDRYVAKVWAWQRKRRKKRRKRKIRSAVLLK